MAEGDLTFGERLGLAIKLFGPRPRGRAEGSIRSFQKVLGEEERGLHGKGSTRQMLHRYLKVDGPLPPDDLIREAAKILSPVRYEWLATGAGEMTEAEQRVTRVEQGGPSNPELTEYIAKQGWTDSTQALFHEAWRRYVAGMPDANIPDYELLFLGFRLVAIIDLPVDHWGLKHELSDRETNDLAVAALHWLMLAMPEPGAGDSFDDAGVRYGNGFDLRYVDDRGERMQAIADKAREEAVELRAEIVERKAELERYFLRSEALLKLLQKRISKGEVITEAMALAAFEEIAPKWSKKETEEEDSDV